MDSGNKKMKIHFCRKFQRDNGELGPNSCLACPEEMNGNNYGWIKIDNLKVNINLCDDCLNKLHVSFRKAGIKK